MVTPNREPLVIQPAPIEVAVAPDPPWHPLTRVGFRFAFSWLVLIYFPFPIGTVPKTEALAYSYLNGVQALGVWVARNFLGITGPIETEMTGSGDRTLDYVTNLIFLVVALVATVVWTALDRRRPSYRRLHRGLRVWVRFTLAGTLLAYGSIKLMPAQMPALLSRLIEPYGQSSPMGLLWTSLGERPAYEIAAGAAEVAAGLLLLFRRTTLLGGLVALGVLGNVVLLNFTYDVSVKLFSLELWLTALFLVLPDLRRVADALVLGRAVPASPPAPRRRGAALVQLVCAAALVYLHLADAFEYYSVSGNGAPEPTVAGIYDVVELTRNGAVLPIVATEPRRYARFAFDHRYAATLEANGSYTRYKLQVDEERHSMTLRRRDPYGTSALTWSRGADGELVLEGLLENEIVRLRLKPGDLGKELLLTSRFHWVHEAPPNR